MTCFIFRTHMQDLQEVTQEVHYENFRAERLASGNPMPAKKPRLVVACILLHYFYPVPKFDGF